MRCYFRCQRSFSPDQQNVLLDHSYTLSSDAKEQYLLRCIESTPINTRDRPDYKGKKTCSYIKEETLGRVCQEFLLCTFGLSTAKLETT